MWFVVLLPEQQISSFIYIIFVAKLKYQYLKIIKLWHLKKFIDNLLSPNFYIKKELRIIICFKKIYLFVYKIMKENCILLIPYSLTFFHISHYQEPWPFMIEGVSNFGNFGNGISILSNVYGIKQGCTCNRSNFFININRQQKWKNDFDFRTAFNWNQTQNEFLKISVYDFTTFYICSEFVFIFIFDLDFLLAKFTLWIFFSWGSGIKHALWI